MPCIFPSEPIMPCFWIHQIMKRERVNAFIINVLQRRTAAKTDPIKKGETSDGLKAFDAVGLQNIP